jgi:hypothetical protein
VPASLLVVPKSIEHAWPLVSCAVFQGSVPGTRSPIARAGAAQPVESDVDVGRHARGDADQRRRVTVGRDAAPGDE